jgi:hypothetical protein
VCFFKKKAFYNYWMDSGTSDLIARYLRMKKLTVEQFRGYIVPVGFVRSPGELDTAPPAGFLYQGAI